MKLRLFALVALSALLVSSCRDNLTPAPKSVSDTIINYPFNGDTKDYSGHGYDGTAFGFSSPTFVNDRFGKPASALQFDGRAEVAMPAAPELNFTGANSYTLSAWINTTSTGSGHIVGRWPSSGTDPGWTLDIANGVAEAQISNVSPGGLQLLGHTPINDGHWHFVALSVSVQSFSSATASLYVDSALEVSKADGTMVPDRNNSGLPAAGDFVGSLDEVLIYAHALSATDVSNRFHEGGWYYHKDSVTTPPVMGWTKGNFGTSQDIQGFCYDWYDTAYCCGAGGTILRTNDGGKSWSPQISGTTQTLYKISFTDSYSGFAGGNAGTLLQTTDGGITWNAVSTAPLSSSDNIRDVLQWGNSVVVVGGNVGAGFIVVSSDAGQTWSKPVSTTLGSFYGVAEVPGVGFLAVGVQGQMYRCPDMNLLNWQNQTGSSGPNFEAVGFSAQGSGMASTFEGAVYLTTDRGITWHLCSPTNVSSQLRTIKMVTNLDAWTAGDNGVILHTVDAGAHWTREDRPDFSGQWNDLALPQYYNPRKFALAGAGGELYCYSW